MARTATTKTLELRTAYVQIGNELSGRMPLAYTHLMQLLCDVLVLFSSLALVSRVGGIFPTALGTGFITLFYRYQCR